MKTNLYARYYIGLERDEYRKDLDLHTNSIDEIKELLVDLSGTESMIFYRFDDDEFEGTSYEIVSGDCSVLVSELGA